jgi:hypothetical protein
MYNFGSDGLLVAFDIGAGQLVVVTDLSGITGVWHAGADVLEKGLTVAWTAQ